MNGYRRTVIWHVDEQQSPSARLPSSHSSPAETVPSPHSGTAMNTPLIPAATARNPICPERSNRRKVAIPIPLR